MDDHQALRIVSALANGAHPTTGEVFAPDSPYQIPDVVRALFAAARALEAQTRSDMPNRDQSNPPPRSPATRGPDMGNAGKPWSSEEDRQLLAEFDSGKSLAEISQLHGRTQGGVRARLEKHGRLEPSPASRWPVNGARRSDSRSAGA